METWQEWVTILVGGVTTFLIGSHQFEKARKQKEIDELKAKLAAQSERITKLESEVVSDKEVREILKEFFLPFMSTLGEIQKDIQEMKVGLAEMRGRNAKESEE